MLTRLIVLLILQCIQKWNHYVAHMKLMQCYMSMKRIDGQSKSCTKHVLTGHLIKSWGDGGAGCGPSPRVGLLVGQRHQSCWVSCWDPREHQGRWQEVCTRSQLLPEEALRAKPLLNVRAGKSSLSFKGKGCRPPTIAIIMIIKLYVCSGLCHYQVSSMIFSQSTTN